MKIYFILNLLIVGIFASHTNDGFNPADDDQLPIMPAVDADNDDEPQFAPTLVRQHAQIRSQPTNEANDSGSESEAGQN